MHREVKLDNSDNSDNSSSESCNNTMIADNISKNDTIENGDKEKVNTNDNSNEKSNDELNDNSKVISVNKGNIDHRRKRVNRIKYTILLIIIMLLLLPSICCIVLLARVNQLQKQVDNITSLYGINKMSNEDYDDRQAYAAVKNANGKISSIVTQAPSNQELKRNHKVLITQTPDRTYPNKKPVINQRNNKGNDNQNKKIKRKAGIYSRKKIYLTFDDGPSRNTVKILNILDKYKIKATFFVIGKTDKESKKIYKRIVKEGHTLGMHSYSHQYKKIYRSVEDFDHDFIKLKKLLYDTTGYNPTIYRFPGGSDNSVNENGMNKFIKYLNHKKMVYFDWNVLNKDATNIEYSKKELVNNVLNGIKNKDRAIVLLHDTQAKESTVKSLPKLIKKLLAGKAQLLPLDKKVKPIQMMKANSIK